MANAVLRCRPQHAYACGLCSVASMHVVAGHSSKLFTIGTYIISTLSCGIFEAEAN